MSERKLCLVDGALGHTGSFLVKFLIESGEWDVVATDLASEDRVKLMTKETVFSGDLKYMDCREWVGENLKYKSADLTNKESLKALFSDEIFPEGKKNYDVIFHPASLYDYFAEYELLHRINYGGLKNFLEVIYEHSEKSQTKAPRFIHWSTCGVYGEPKYQKNKKGFINPISEESEFDPPNNYSVTKTEQELLIDEWTKEHPDFQWTILRSAPIYGPYQTYGMFHIYYLIDKLGYMFLPKIFPKRKKLMMPMVHVEDLVRGAIFLAGNHKSIHQVYNLCGDPALEEDFMQFTYELIGIPYQIVPVHWVFYKFFSRIAFKLSEKKNKKAKKLGIRPKFDLPMAGYITHQYYFSNQKLKDLGFEFEYGDFKTGTHQTVMWYLKHGWLPRNDFKLPDFVNTEPKPSIPPKIKYKTPMEGGEIFD